MEPVPRDDVGGPAKDTITGIMLVFAMMLFFTTAAVRAHWPGVLRLPTSFLVVYF
jgi:hypothetical protein